MFERVVVALDGSAEARSAGRVGLRIAEHFGSEVTAISVIDVRAVEGPAVETLAPLWGEVSGRPFQPEVLRLYRERAEDTLEAFERDARSIGVRVAIRRADIGVAEDTILQRADGADLLVAGRRGEHAGFGKHAVGATLWRILHRCGCPVLVGPTSALPDAQDDEPAGLPRQPLIAWDDTGGGRAALQLAIAYASTAGVPIRLVHAGDESDDDEMDGVCATLSRASVVWESARLDTDPAEAVAEAARRWEADCLFMGAFGRGRLRGYLLGSHTEGILERFGGLAFVAPPKTSS